MPTLAKTSKSVIHFAASISPVKTIASMCKGKILSSPRTLVLGTVHLNTFLQRSKLLINTATGWAGSLAANELSAEGPGLRNTPSLGNEVVDDWVVVLEVAAETFVGEGGPSNELGHSLSVLIPCV